MERTIVLTGGSPWGFTLAGGRDFGSHLQVSKLTGGGKAANGGVKERDFILKINGEETQGVTHFGAQQLIKSSGQQLTLILSNEAPLKSAYAPAQGTPTQTTPTSGSEAGRPRPPPPPDTTPTSTTSTSGGAGRPRPPPPTTPTSTTPVKATPPVKPVQPVQPVARPPTFVNDNSENDPIFQSPTFKKITYESPSAFSPKAEQTTITPPTQPMKHMTIEDGNTRKSTQRPPPPSNTPTTFTPTTMKVSSTNKGPSPVKPSPPPSVKRPPPPSSVPVVSPSPTSQPPATGSAGTSAQNKITSRQGVCEACHEPIRGSYSSAMNKVWHPEHFICSYCRIPLSGGTFIFEDDKIFCNTCYEKKVAQMCSHCRKAIVGPMVNATNRYYHQECFKCSRCAANLSQQDGFNMENNMLFCSDCYGEAYGATCHGCNQRIGGSELWVEALDHNWHPQCFVCGGCSRPLEGTKFFAKLGRPYCGQC